MLVHAGAKQLAVAPFVCKEELHIVLPSVLFKLITKGWHHLLDYAGRRTPDTT